MYVAIHTKTGCPYCVMAKQFFDDHSISYDELIYDNTEVRNNLYDKLGLTEATQRTVPQIFIDQVRIGGYSDLLKISIFNSLK